MTLKDINTALNAYVHFGDVALRQCGEQCQYVSRYVDGRIAGYPNLGKGLRFIGKPSDYHDLRIHKDDVEEFVRRYKAHKEEA
jgi:hypothetical protein